MCVCTKTSTKDYLWYIRIKIHAHIQTKIMKDESPTGKIPSNQKKMASIFFSTVREDNRKEKMHACSSPDQICLIEYMVYILM